MPAVSLYAIVADPDRFDSKEVLTAGIAFVGEGTPTLWLNRESARDDVFMNAVCLDVSRCKNRKDFLAQGDGRSCWFRATVDAKAKSPEYPPVEFACTLRVIECTVIHKGE